MNIKLIETENFRAILDPETGKYTVKATTALSKTLHRIKKLSAVVTVDLQGKGINELMLVLNVSEASCEKLAKI